MKSRSGHFNLALITSSIVALSLASAPQPGVAKPGAARANASTANAGPGQEAMAAVEGKVEPLVRQFYPKAKIKKTPSAMHFEFKTRDFDIPQTDTVEPGPDWGGIICDIKLESGPRAENKEVEEKLNQYSYYHVMELRPNSPTSDCHLETRMGYPFDVQPDFLQGFKTIIRDFEKPAALASPAAHPAN